MDLKVSTDRLGSIRPHGGLEKSSRFQFPSDGPLEGSLRELVQGASRYQRTPVRERIALAEACLEGTARLARDWVDAACETKGVRSGNPARAEEVLVGPIITVRYLRLLIQSLAEIAENGMPRLPGRAVEAFDGRIHVPVVPAKGLYDRAVFAGYRGYVRMQNDVARDSLADRLAAYYRRSLDPGRVALVLGAGNVSSIPATDTFGKVFEEGKAVLLKMNPVNESLGPIFEQAFAPLIDAGILRIIYGGQDVGSQAVYHRLVDEVHVTGSVETHESIVWGPPGPERERRKRDHEPLMAKRLTSELGSVSPWIVVPGPYSAKQLRFQAENIVTSVVNNASFNCVSTDVVLTWKRWPHRKPFLDLIERRLRSVPPRRAYYPGAQERFEQFTGRPVDQSAGGALPWEFRRGMGAQEAARLFQQEPFVPFFAEVPLDADSPEAFFHRAVEFANENLWGTLCAAVTVHPRTRFKDWGEARFASILHGLRYGSIGVNQWPGYNYALASLPWGGYPGGTLADPQSGLGWVHNPYMLDGVEQSVLDGPLTVTPKPLPFPSHRAPEPIAWQLLNLYRSPSLARWSRLAVSSLRGMI